MLYFKNPEQALPVFKALSSEVRLKILNIISENEGKKIPGLAEVRTAAFDDIDTAVCMTAESTLAFLKRAGRKVDPMTEKTCQYYKNKAAISL